MNYKNSLLALLLVGCSSVFAVDFNPENQVRAREMFCREMTDLKDRCDESIREALESVNLEMLQRDQECVDLACRMARMMRERESECSLDMMMEMFRDMDGMKVMCAFMLCKSCMNDLMREEASNC